MHLKDIYGEYSGIDDTVKDVKQLYIEMFLI